MAAAIRCARDGAPEPEEEPDDKPPEDEPEPPPEDDEEEDEEEPDELDSLPLEEAELLLPEPLPLQAGRPSARALASSDDAVPRRSM
ncbi:MAG: hypothetical protein OSA97_04070 [Nevskia sp.]|nr:hypothetical protein [Nevskia sp.]